MLKILDMYIYVGSSAIDIALEAKNFAKEVQISSRRGSWLVPRFILNQPYDHWYVYSCTTLFIYIYIYVCIMCVRETFFVTLDYVLTINVLFAITQGVKSISLHTLVCPRFIS